MLYVISLVAQLVKNPSAMQETPVRHPGWEDPLEEGMATHSSILAWRITGSQRVGDDWAAKHSMYAFHLFETAILSSGNYFHIVVTAEFFILFCHKSMYLWMLSSSC